MTLFVATWDPFGILMLQGGSWVDADPNGSVLAAWESLAVTAGTPQVTCLVAHNRVLHLAITSTPSDDCFGVLFRREGNGFVVEKTMVEGGFYTFVEHHGDLYCIGNVGAVGGRTDGDARLAMYRRDGATWTALGEDTDRNVNHVWTMYRAGITNPFDTSEIITGAWDDDSWTTWSPQDGWVPRADPGGSCIWGFGFDGTNLHSGDYGGLEYLSNDGHAWPNVTNTIERPLNGGEIWQYITWRGVLYAVGCDAGPTTQEGFIWSWNGTRWVEQATLETGGTHVGFIDVVESNGALYLPCGGEPSYYGSHDHAGAAGVYRYNGSSLARVGNAFAGQPYLIADGLGASARLRQWQRDDVTSRVGQVTSTQRSQRQGVPNSYF